MKTTMSAAVKKRARANGRARPLCCGALVCALVGIGLLAACVPAEVAGDEELDARVFPKMDDIATCGDGFLAREEQCDGSLPLRDSCESLGYAGGELSCTNCVYNVQACNGNGCGDGVLQSGEACDYGVLFGTFQQAGPLSEERGCTEACELAAAVCNDGIVAWPGETCDGTRFIDPERIQAGWQVSDYEAGSVTCDPESCQVDLTQAYPARCGNGIRELGEDCDAEGEGFEEPDGQRWQCVGCARVDLRSRCGDGAVQRDFGETCESASNAWSRWCDPDDRSLGQVACVDCQIDRSDCPPSPPDPEPDPEFDAEEPPPDEGGALDPDANAGPGDDAESGADVGSRAEPEPEPRPAQTGCSAPATPATGLELAPLLLVLWAGRRRRGGRRSGNAGGEVAATTALENQRLG